MTSPSLQSFSPPEFLSTLLSNSVSMGTAVMGILLLVFAFWALYTVIAVYHWLKYSHASTVAFPAIGIHLFISFGLIVYALSGTFIL